MGECSPKGGVSLLQDYLLAGAMDNVHLGSKGCRSRVSGLFRAYEGHRPRFKTMEGFVEWYNCRIHGGLDRKMGITPDEAAYSRLSPDSMLGLFFRRMREA